MIEFVQHAVPTQADLENLAQALQSDRSDVAVSSAAFSLRLCFATAGMTAGVEMARRNLADDDEGRAGAAEDGRDKSGTHRLDAKMFRQVA